MSYIDVMDKIIDSEDTTVGGGSASAMSGAMASGLIGMVARLSTKKDFGLTKERYLEIADRLDFLCRELLKGAEEDTKAYLLIKKAYSMPKNTDEEKEARKAAIQNAGVEAATVPKDNALRCKEVYELGLEIEGKSNSAAYSDLVIGINLAKLGIDGCIMNIEANLSLIKDEDILTAFKNDIIDIKP